MASLNCLCSVCRREPSSMYCSCSQAAVYLCDGCFIPHKNKDPRLVHMTVPVNVTDISRYQQRCAAFAQGRTELLQNLTRIDQCCAEVTAAVDALINRAQQFRDDFIGKMQERKQEVSRHVYESIAEAEASLDKEDVQLNTSFAYALRNFAPGSLSFFKFEVPQNNRSEAFLQSLVKIEYSQIQKGEHLIFWVTKENLKWFDVSTERMSPVVSLQLAIKCDGNSRWVNLDATRVVVCGGGQEDDEYLSSAYLLNTAGVVHELPYMIFGHRSMGLIVWNGAVHVFGSYDGEGKKKCELLNMASCTRWDSLPDMLHHRPLFTPVLWCESVYLCGGLETQSVEVFDGRSMRLLELRLPESGQTLGCVREGLLLLLTDNFWSIVSQPAALVTTQRLPSKINVNTKLVCWKTTLFTLYDGEVRRYSAEDGHVL